MSELVDNTYKFIDEVINSLNVRDYDFYSNIILKVCNIFPKANVAIYIQEDVDYVLKTSVISGELSTEYKIDSALLDEIINCKQYIFKTKQDKFFKEYSIVQKLSINGSCFGFCVLSLDSEPDKLTVNSFLAIVNIISYKIKDFELSQVYKLQLKALQDAIRDRDSAYRVIDKQHKKLQELDKTKSLFLANISHDLRTPLNAIIGFSQALDSQIFGELNDKQAEYIKDIQISSLHLLGMINEILDLSKLEANAMKFNPTQLNPSVAINEVVNILEPLYKDKNIKIITNLDDGFKIYADNQKFQQILYNLLSNAIKFTKNNGKIVIDSKKDNDNYILSILDNGIGIDKKFQNKIFKKYVHLNNNNNYTQGSTGLGLAITKELAKLHKGTITLESELNKGSKFTINFKKIVI